MTPPVPTADAAGVVVDNPPVTPNGSWRSTIGSSPYAVDPARYHLYAAFFCPFASRVLLTRQLKGLQQFLPVDIVRPYPKPWLFPETDDEYPDATVDSLFHSRALSEVYRRNEPDRKDKFSVPMLWDKGTGTIVNNESEDIMRMLNHVFDEYLPEGSEGKGMDFYPPGLREQIDEVNAWLMPELNVGVYKAGFAGGQETYEKACLMVFEALRKLEDVVRENGGLYLVGGRLTEVDLKAYCTLIRFDPVYVQHFKLNIGTIRHDFPILNRYIKHMYWKIKGFKEVTNFKHIKENYTKSHKDINPKSITPLGPIPDIEPWTEEDEAWLTSQSSKAVKGVL